MSEPPQKKQKSIDSFFSRVSSVPRLSSSTTSHAPCVTSVSSTSNANVTNDVPASHASLNSLSVTFNDSITTESEINVKAHSAFQQDIGLYIDKYKSLSDELKLQLLTNPYKPNASYNFKEDALDFRRPFVYACLNQYSPWLAYSRLQKGVCASSAYYFLSQ